MEAPPGGTVTHQNRLYRVSATGRLSAPVAIASATLPDFSNPAPLPDFSNPAPLPDVASDPAAFRKEFERQQALSNMEAIDQIAAHAGADGRVDVLVRRSSHVESRKGTTFFQVSSDGRLTMEVSLEAAIVDEGLRIWTDFSVEGSQITLYGATGTRQNRLPQGYLSRIDIPNGRAVTRLAPLSELGLDAAINARDEQVQHLEHYPGQQPVLLTRLGTQPLMVAMVMRSRRPAIQLDEGTEQLAVLTASED
jgi:hypothetical protein